MLIILGAVVVFFVGLGSSGLFGLLGLTNPFQSKTIDRSQPALLVSIQELQPVPRSGWKLRGRHRHRG